jgi:predicted hotdog family 3-hydroxylacyl-ACP dehydratase
MSVAIETLIPHRAPMRWIDALTDCTDTTASATACFGADHFAVADGAVLETALVECVAQTVAAALGHRTQTNGQSDPARNGMLAAVSNFRIQSPAPTGKILRIEIRELKRFGPMLLVSGVVSCEGQIIASGELMLYA